MTDLLNELNENQRDAVINYKGPSLVIAGAGSGKTRVLTYRIAYMLKEGVNPATILALTFTNKAANEMKERIGSLVGPHHSRKLWMGTFHSIFSRILRYESSALNYPSDYTIYDSVDSRNLIKTIIKELSLDEKIYKASEVQGRISMAKNNLITSDVYASSAEIISKDQSSRRPAISDIYLRYSARCKKSGAMDFDDLLLNTNILFRNHPEILDKYRTAFRFILVDEYQDTNFAQYLILKSLAGKHNNICVVGDDAQSIYSFRGARIENILKFRSDYTDSMLFKLERNYRSTQIIVDAGNSLISKNKEQIPKRIYSQNNTGEKIQVIEARTDNEEGFLVASMIRDMVFTRQLQYNDFAILYRTNAQSRIFEEALRKNNIPYRVYGGMSFFQRREVKDLLSYLRLVVNPNDDESLKRIINYPLRGIGKTTILKIEQLAQSSGKTIWQILNDKTLLTKEFNSGTYQKLCGFLGLILDYRRKSGEMEAFDLAYTIASNSGVIRDLNQDKTPEGISRMENVQELLNGIREFTENPDNTENTSLSAYLQTVTLYTDADNDKDEDRNKVFIMTIHSAKGLEFKNVFIAGMEEDLFPSFMSVNTVREIEEERRLFYVALTRAMENVFITYSASRYKWGLLSNCRPSRFISEIDENYLSLPAPLFNSVSGNNNTGIFTEKITSPPSSRIIITPDKKLKKIAVAESPTPPSSIDPYGIMTGMVVEHERFGKGKVISKDGIPPNTKATVFFKEHGQKQLLLKFARLKIIS